MKKKFLLIAVVASSLFCLNCGEENKSGETEKTKVEKSKEDKGDEVSLASESEVALTTTTVVDGSLLSEPVRETPKAKASSSALSRGVMKELAASPKTTTYPIEPTNVKFTKDINKVLKMVEGVHSTGKTVLGGRRGKVDGAFNEGVAGSGGIGDALAGLMAGSASRPSESRSVARKSSVRAKSAPRASSKFAEASTSEVYLMSDSDESSEWSDDEPALRKTRRRYGESNERRSGLLTAGEWNDLEHWYFWDDIINDDNFSGKADYWQFFPKKLVAVKVVDRNGKGAANVSVILLNGKKVEFVTKTDNAGYAYCWIGLMDGEFDEVRARDLMLVVDGTLIKEQIQVTSRGDERLNMNVVMHKNVRRPKASADVAFIVDATGSMKDEIKFLKSDLSYIIDHASSESNIPLRTAAVFYRDKGDDYLTRHHDFSKNVSVTRDFVAEQDADDGGDYPEAVHSALETALKKLSWDESARARVAFLILDAPAHHEDDVIESLQKSITLFALNGIKLIPVAASGVDKDTEFMLRFFDLATGGTYVFLTDDSGIGNSHIKATVGNHKVERLANLMVRLIKKYVE